MLDTLRSRASFGLLGHLLGLLASGGLVWMGQGSLAQAAWGALELAAALALLEALAFAFDFRLRRLKALAPSAFPFKKMPEDERAYLQDALLRLPGRSAGRAGLVWLGACGALSLHAFLGGAPVAPSSVMGLLLGLPVSALTQYLGNLAMGRRVAPFYFFKEGYAESLAAYHPKLSERFFRFALLPLAVLLPLPVVATALLETSVPLLIWLWVGAWALGFLWAAKSVFHGLVAEPARDLALALGRLGEGDYAALLDVTSGDELGAATEKLNKAVRSTDRRFFVLETFGTMLPPARQAGIFEAGIKLDGEEREFGVLEIRFEGQDLDLRSFNRACGAAIAVVDARGGVLESVTPGSIRFLFGAPLSGEKDREAALLSAWELGSRLDVHCNQRRMQSGIHLRWGGGLAWGGGVLGLLGPEGRQRYAATGSVVEEARLLAQGHGLRLSPALRAELPEAFKADAEGRLAQGPLPDIPQGAGTGLNFEPGSRLS